MSWIRTASGRRFDLERPRPESVCPTDIAHALAHQCRFNGHCRVFYSVAEHSVLVALMVPREHKLAALLHDAAEAYVGDMVRPLKRTLPAFQDAERRVMKAIALRFGLGPDAFDAPDIKQADDRALALEARQLMGVDPGDWGLVERTEDLAHWPQHPLSPAQARLLFGMTLEAAESRRCTGGAGWAATAKSRTPAAPL